MNASLTNRQNEILRASIDIIHYDGIQRFTIKNLSNRIGFTEAAIYRHFKNKNDILCSVLDSFIIKLENFVSSLKEQEISSFDKIKSIYDRLSITFTEKPAYVSIIFAEEIFKNNKELSKKVGKILELNNKAFNSIITKGQKNNEITNEIGSQELTLMTMGALRLMVKNWLMCEFTFNLKTKSEKLFSSIKILLEVK